VFVRIIATPPGEAPEEVRRAWVGLVLPLVAGETGCRAAPVGGVLSGPRTFLGKLLKLLTGRRRYVRGDVVDAPQALTLLAEREPRAALWWREHAPHCWQPGARFIFKAEVCVEVTGAVGRPASSGRIASTEFFSAGPSEVTRDSDRRSRHRSRIADQTSSLMTGLSARCCGRPVGSVMVVVSGSRPRAW
jgi:hypothetical protein